MTNNNNHDDDEEDNDNENDGKEKDEEWELIGRLASGGCLWQSQLSVPFLSTPVYSATDYTHHHSTTTTCLIINNTIIIQHFIETLNWCLFM